MMLTLSDLVHSLISSQLAEAMPLAMRSKPITELVIDSRKATVGSLFVALPGEHQDGHDFVPAAFATGSVAAITDQAVQFDGLTLSAEPASWPQTAQEWRLPICLRVANSMIGLQQLAADWRSRFAPNVIGITGSIGKTSTKELTYRVLSQKFNTLHSLGSMNNEIGLPLTLMTLNESHEQVVLEMGTYGAGEIETLCRIARPHVGLVTNIGPTHLERMGTIENIVTAKRELIETLDQDGTAVLNHDDARVMSMADYAAGRVLTYGLTPKADLWADQLVSEGLEGIRFVFHHQQETVPVTVPLLGRHSVYTALAAAAVGLSQAMSWDEIVPGLQDKRAQLRLMTTPGPNGSIILDDTYNANATSSIAALDLLDELIAGRKIAVLGDMAELGVETENEHRKVGRRVVEVVDMLITLGPKARLIAEEATADGFDRSAIISLDTAETLFEQLNQIAAPGDMILIKGSRSLRLESIVAKLTAASAEAT